jgi:hypothetical protein
MQGLNCGGGRTKKMATLLHGYPVEYGEHSWRALDLFNIPQSEHCMSLPRARFAPHCVQHP